MIALSLLGSASLLLSCDDAEGRTEAPNTETLMTEHSEHLSIVMSENGRKSYFFRTPLLEGYMLARDPYREFRKGVEITTYQDDSLSTVNAVLTANYAIYYENRKLWEAKGNVVVIKTDGTKLYTQQLFWNSMTERIYSNVDTKIVKGTDVFYGEGFESDEELKQWRFRRMTGRMFVNVEQDDADAEGPAAESRDGRHSATAGEMKSEGSAPQRTTAGDKHEPASGGDKSGDVSSPQTPSRQKRGGANTRPARRGAEKDTTLRRRAALPVEESAMKLKQ